MTSEGSRREILELNGWSRQFIANEPRLSEALELYKEAGFEVLLEPLPKPAETVEVSGSVPEANCRQCFDGLEDQYKIIYTRPKKDRSALDGDLF